MVSGGGKNQAAHFQPRSFNMGIRRKVFEVTGGFVFDRLAEDIELSIRMKKAGFRVGLIPDAFVYHKRRTSLGQFFQQVQGFGVGRVRVGSVHPAAVKLTHWLPSFFLLGLLSIPISFFLIPLWASWEMLLLFLYLWAIFIGGYQSTRSFQVAALCIPSALVQLTGYGLGFLKGKFRKNT